MVSTLIWVDFLGARFEVGRGKITPRPLSKTRQSFATNLKFGTSKHSYVVSENITFSSKPLLILLMSAFFAKTFFGQNSTFTQSNNVRAVF